MSKFNAYMNSHFAGCRLLAEGLDICRGREVRAFLLPGYFDDVGFSDGTDAWIVPLAAESCAGSGNLLRGVNLRELIGRFRNGETPAVVRGAELAKAQPAAGGRRRLTDVAFVPAPASPIPARRRLALDVPAEPQPTATRRRHADI